MKFKRIILLVALFMLSTVGVYADNGPLHIDLKSYMQKRDSLFLVMIVNSDEMNLKSRQHFSLKPIITDGADTCLLPSVELMGKRAYKKYRNRAMKMKKKGIVEKTLPYAVVLVTPDSKNLYYSVGTPFLKWMEAASLNIENDEVLTPRQQKKKASNKKNILSLKNAYDPNKGLFIHGAPVVAYMKPVLDEDNERTEEMECIVDFEMGKWEINPDYLRNPKELRKIKELVNRLRTDNCNLSGVIEIVGYSSPDGSESSNKKISIKRASELESYIIEQSGFDKSMIRARYGAENWSGFRRAVSRSTIQYKDSILNILESDISIAEKKKKLKAIDSCSVYNELDSTVFDRLRTAKCYAKYTIRPYTLSEIKAIMNDNPKDLALNELYKLSDSYAPGSKEYLDVVNITVRMYPNDATANINAAAAAIEDRDINAAETYLSKVKTRVRIPEYDNCKGILEAMMGNRQAAEEYLKAAASAGLQAAKDNLKRIEK